jgi:hypothetical protein
MTVFLSNTDQLGFLEPDLTRDIIGAYQNMHHYIDRGHEMWQEVERERGSELRAVATGRVRPEAGGYVQRVEAWLKETRTLRRRLIDTPSVRS